MLGTGDLFKVQGGGGLGALLTELHLLVVLPEHQVVAAADPVLLCCCVQHSRNGTGCRAKLPVLLSGLKTWRAVLHPAPTAQS